MKINNFFAHQLKVKFQRAHQSQKVKHVTPLPLHCIAWWMYENLVISLFVSSLNDRHRCKSTQFFHTQLFISKSKVSSRVVPWASQMNDTCCGQQIIPKSVRHNLGLQNPDFLSGCFFFFFFYSTKRWHFGEDARAICRV